uniref:ShKT domain-containing protein n=1 Tax=Ascaris lumbricoides TaxID=6252 RepID=A0A0M3HR29_ASCLU
MNIIETRKSLLKISRLDFWRPPSSVNNSIDIMVYPEIRKNFTDWLDIAGFHYEIAIKDLAELILKREIPRRFGHRHNLFSEHRLKDDRSSSSTLPMGEYYSYDEIVQWMRNLERLHRNIVRVVSIGTTHQGRNIFGVVLVSGYENNPKITEYVDTLNIYIFPCINPDGYEYTRSDQRDPAIRMWRKNMSPEKCYTKDGKKRCCKGVDLNRNFAFRFAEVGSSSSPCSEIHHGENAFSEPESRAVRDAVLSLSNRLDAFITLHTYSQLWIYPYSHRKYAYSADVNDLVDPYAGGSADWAKESGRVKYSYTIELRPSYFEWNGFVLDRRQLVPTGRETFEGVKVVIDKVIEEDKRRRGEGKYVSCNHSTTNSLLLIPYIAKIRHIRSGDALLKPCVPFGDRLKKLPGAKVSGIEIPCVDVSPACSHWISDNPSICQRAEHAMEKQCQKSCSFC